MEGFIICVKCEKKLRPVYKICKKGHLICQSCNQHQNADTGVAEEASHCQDVEFTMTKMNTLFRNQEDDCQYKCGHRSSVVDLGAHEKDCIMNIKCAISDCSWNKALSELVQHVEDTHSGCVIDLSSSPNCCIIDFENPVLLLTQFHKNHPSNEIYWLRLHKYDNSNYIMMQYQGHTGEKNENDLTIKEYSVSSVERANVYVSTEVVHSKSKVKNIMSDDFMIRNGTDLNIFKCSKFMIKMIELSPPLMMTEAVKADFECFICTEMLIPPIRMCSGGHSMCKNCADRITTCGKCRKEITQARNYTLESLIENLTKRRRIAELTCKYKPDGCKITGSLEMMLGHESICTYQVTKCVLRVELYVCNWKGLYLNLQQHIKERHSKAVRTFGPRELTVGFRNEFYFIDEHCFLFVFQPFEMDYKFMVYEITNQRISNFKFQIDLYNVKTGLSYVIAGVCKPVVGQKFWINYLQDNKHNTVPISWVRDCLLTQNKSFCLDINIIRNIV